MAKNLTWLLLMKAFQQHQKFENNFFLFLTDKIPQRETVFLETVFVAIIDVFFIK